MPPHPSQTDPAERQPGKPLITHAAQSSPTNDRELTHRFATERRHQLTVLLIVAAAVLLVSVLLAGPRNIFLHNWWHIDLP